MNETIRLYINIIETRHRKHLEIVQSLLSVQKKILKLKNWLKSYRSKVNVYTNISFMDDSFEVVVKTSDYPISIRFSLTNSVYFELDAKRNNPDYHLIVLEHLYKLARSEYNRIGEKYNKVRRANIGRSRTLRWR